MEYEAHCVLDVSNKLWVGGGVDYSYSRHPRLTRNIYHENKIKLGDTTQELCTCSKSPFGVKEWKATPTMSIWQSMPTNNLYIEESVCDSKISLVLGMRYISTERLELSPINGARSTRPLFHLLLFEWTLHIGNSSQQRERQHERDTTDHIAPFGTEQPENWKIGIEFFNYLCRFQWEFSYWNSKTLFIPRSLLQGESYWNCSRYCNSGINPAIEFWLISIVNSPFAKPFIPPPHLSLLMGLLCSGSKVLLCWLGVAGSHSTTSQMQFLRLTKWYHLFFHWHFHGLPPLLESLAREWSETHMNYELYRPISLSYSLSTLSLSHTLSSSSAICSLTITHCLSLRMGVNVLVRPRGGTGHSRMGRGKEGKGREKAARLLAFHNWWLLWLSSVGEKNGREKEEEEGTGTNERISIIINDQIREEIARW